MNIVRGLILGAKERTSSRDFSLGLGVGCVVLLEFHSGCHFTHREPKLGVELRPQIWTRSLWWKFLVALVFSG